MIKKCLILILLLLSSVTFFINVRNVKSETLFYDAFESADMSAWTSTTTTSGELITAIDFGYYPYNYEIGGIYACFAYLDGDGDTERAYASYQLSEPISFAYLHGYFYIHSTAELDEMLNETDDRINFLSLFDDVSDNTLASLGIARYSDNTIRWRITSQIGTKSTTLIFPNLEQWYELELLYSSELDGQIYAWVDGQLVILLTGDTTPYGMITDIRCGIVFTSGIEWASNIYMDNITLSDSPIGQYQYPEQTEGDIDFLLISNEGSYNIENIELMLSNFGYTWRLLAPENVTNSEIFEGVDAVITFAGSVHPIAFPMYLEQYALNHIVISHMYEYANQIEPTLDYTMIDDGYTTFDGLQRFNVTFIREWGIENSAIGDKYFNENDIVQYYTSTSPPHIRCVNTTALDLLDDVTKIAKFNDTYTAFFYQGNNYLGGNGFYVLDLNCQRAYDNIASAYFLYPILNLVEPYVKAGMYAKQMWNGLYWNDYAWITNKMFDLAYDYSDFITMISMGKSYENRDIWAMFIGINNNDTKSYYYSVNVIHGNEPLHAVTSLRMVEILGYWLENDMYYWRTRMREKTLIVIPVMNPDGYVAVTRNNVNATDLNRDFPPYGTTQLSQNETKALSDFMDLYPPQILLDFHTPRVNHIYYEDDATATDIRKASPAIQQFCVSKGLLINETYTSLKHYGYASSMINFIGDSATYETVNGTLKTYIRWKYGKPAMTFEMGGGFNGSRFALNYQDLYCVAILQFVYDITYDNMTIPTELLVNFYIGFIGVVMFCVNPILSYKLSGNADDKFKFLFILVSIGIVSIGLIFTFIYSGL